MPYVNVKLAGGPVSVEQKQQIIAGMTEVLFKVLNKPPQATYVVIEEHNTDNWGVGGESLTVRRARQSS
ncbi:MAG: 4-oxalocrotonate tautomerase family protein [Proteobacteria bacterium]|nr:4-oxalocrotonate tautomerase family protein [Pseudomonadota bacterium]MBU1450114.1 4-oxalocrotonate tautomerase family protein [Pseudomonadota bacterium]MBU2468328.1 4-oxalocrotonate tautomerase family protein [Pseudomonadota bacterium]MBU2515985.1 4-oxalocrotonate tautomerase family protein [Pseudomonadota bacterium]